MITGYFMAPVRGEAGDSVEHSVKWDNIRFALEIANWLERNFPDVNWYIPHRHEEFIEALMRQGISSQKIVSAFGDIASDKDFGVVYDGNGIGEGMKREIAEMTIEKKPLVFIEETSETAKEQIALVIAKARENRK